jgi:hypothetical protein
VVAIPEVEDGIFCSYVVRGMSGMTIEMFGWR